MMIYASNHSKEVVWSRCGHHSQFNRVRYPLRGFWKGLVNHFLVFRCSFLFLVVYFNWANSTWLHSDPATVTSCHLGCNFSSYRRNCVHSQSTSFLLFWRRFAPVSLLQEPLENQPSQGLGWMPPLPSVYQTRTGKERTELSCFFSRIVFLSTWCAHKPAHTLACRWFAWAELPDDLRRPKLFISVGTHLQNFLLTIMNSQ